MSDEYYAERCREMKQKLDSLIWHLENMDGNGRRHKVWDHANDIYCLMAEIQGAYTK